MTDIDRFRAFYDDVFGLPVAYEVPDDADDASRAQLAFRYGGVIQALGNSLLGLRPVATDSFDENGVGLDPVSFAVASRADLDTVVAALFEFRDPDGITLELFSPRA